jgi:hypothetical protein
VWKEGDIIQVFAWSTKGNHKKYNKYRVILNYYRGLRGL